jgi:hypothetical protein
MAEPDPLANLIEQAKRIARYHPDLAAFYVAAIREKARGVKPEEMEPLLGDLLRAAAPSGRPSAK